MSHRTSKSINLKKSQSGQLVTRAARVLRVSMDRRPPGGLTTSGLLTEAVNRDEYGRPTLLPSDGEWVEAVAWGC